MATDEQPDYPELVERLDRIADLLALRVIQTLERDEKIRTLDAVGYTPTQIGKLIGERANTISVFLTRSRQAAGRRKARTRKKTSTGRRPR